MQCLPAKVKEDEHLGRYMEATREIKAGDILLKEKPLITGPTQVSLSIQNFKANLESSRDRIANKRLPEV